MASQDYIEFGLRRRRKGHKTQAEEFTVLYKENYALVYNYVRYLVIDQTAAEDVTSEAFLKAARSFSRFDPTRAKFSTWVITIARNCAFDYFDSNKPTAALDDVSEGAYSAPDEFVGQLGDADLVVHLLEALDEDERELVFMKYNQGLRNTEIATMLNMNQSTVSTKLSRAITKMRTAAEGCQ